MKYNELPDQLKPYVQYHRQPFEIIIRGRTAFGHIVMSKISNRDAHIFLCTDEAELWGHTIYDRNGHLHSWAIHHADMASIICDGKYYEYKIRINKKPLTLYDIINFEI